MRFLTRPKGHVVDLLFTLALFCVFAFSSLSVAVIGANVYRSTVNNMGQNFSMRTSLAYVTEKVRQNDTAGAVYVQQLDDKPALVLEQSYNGTTYQTWIYHKDGSLRELFIRKGVAFSAQDGQEITQINAFSVALPDEGLLEFSMTDEQGQTVRQAVSLRCA